MNIFTGEIKEIKKNSVFNLIKVEVENISFYALTLQLKAKFGKGSKVNLFFKETEVLITKSQDHVIGAENVIHGVVDFIVTGEFFSELIISIKCGKISALLTNQSLKTQHVKKGDMVFAVIKANEISLETL